MLFRRSLRFGTPVNPNQVNAVYRHGLLLITMPKAEEAKPRQVRVQVGEPGHLTSQSDSQAQSDTQANAQGVQQNGHQSQTPG